jgi:hypothetical protein
MPKLLKSLIFHVSILFGVIPPRNELKQPRSFLFAATVLSAVDLLSPPTGPDTPTTRTKEHILLISGSFSLIFCVEYLGACLLPTLNIPLAGNCP